MDVISEIQKQYLFFSEKEKIIADYILKEKSNIKNINIGLLATTVGVSNGTITRFCKKVGCPSFASFKISLSRENIVKNEHDDADYIGEVFEFYKTVILRTNNLIHDNILKSIVGKIKTANKISIYGMGNSAITATEFMLRLLRMGFNVQSITDPHLMIMNSALGTQNDLVIIISVSGETTELIRAAKVAAPHGCTLVCITSAPNSTLASYATEVLTVFNTIFIDEEQFINRQFPVIYAIDLISTLLLKDNTLKQKMETTVDSILKQNDDPIVS